MALIKKWDNTNTGKDMVKLAPHAADENLKWCRCFARQSGNSLKD